MPDDERPADLEALKIAFQRALERDVMGIEQIDVDLCEDGETVMVYGYTADPANFCHASFPMPVLKWTWCHDG